MRLLGWKIDRQARPASPTALARSRRRQAKTLSPVDNRGGWWPIIRESFAGAWQNNVTVTVEDGLRHWAVFRAVQIIAGDIAKMRIKLVEQQGVGGIWSEVEVSGFSEVLAKPNNFQTRIQFVRNWMESKLTRGNTYVLKRREPDTERVVALYVLDPNRTTPMVDERGNVFYELCRDDLVGLNRGPNVLVPASEIIHDRWNTLYHPLVGLSPIYAVGINALTALSIEKNSARLFTNGARPGGVLSAPGKIAEATALRLKQYWQENFTGAKAGDVAVLGDGLKFEALSMSAVDAQMIEQLKWSDTTIFGCYGIPAYMGNVGTAPAYNNVEALAQQYYSQALQVHIEDIELLLDEGLELSQQGKRRLGTEFDLDNLLRMDTATLVKTAVEGLKGIFSPDEARARLNLGPTPGGKPVYLQQQNFSLEALAKRDAKDDPFAGAPSSPASDAPAAGAGDAAAGDNTGDQTDQTAKALEAYLELEAAA